MDLSNPATQANLEAAFGGESMANRKYLFFADVAKQLGGEGEAAIGGAMVASWVSQASFNPPGFTVAVARERAVESLLHVGTPEKVRPTAAQLV